MMISRLAIYSFLAIGFLVGCGSQPEVRIVEGTVSFAGKPLNHGMLSFQPGAGKMVGTPILSDGRFSVELVPGDYQISVNSPPQLPAGFKEGDPLPPPDPNALPQKFFRKETSGLSAKIEAGSGPQTVDFTMQ